MTRARAALRRRRPLHTLLAAVALAWGLPPASARITVLDDAQHTLHLAAPARRIVSLSPAATESLFAIGAGAQVVGTSAYSDYPPAAKQVPRIGDAFALNREAVAGLKPDLAVVWGSGTPAQRVAELRALGIAIYVSEPLSTDDIASTLERYGELTGHAREGRDAAHAFRTRIGALRQQYAVRQPVDAFLQISAAPLMTVNARHVFSEALAICGARNVFGDLARLAATIGPEAVLARDPQLIIALEMPGDAAAALAPWRRHTALRAVRSGNLAAISPDLISRAAPSFAEGVAVLCERVDRARRTEGTAITR